MMRSLQILAPLINDVTRADDTTLLDQELLLDAVNLPLTLDDFCDLLAACSEDYAWELDDIGQLVGLRPMVLRVPGMSQREYVGSFDTLTAVAYSLNDIHYDAGLDWDQAAAALDLPLALASEIVAAEDADLPHDRALRTRLLHIVGLGEGGHHG